MVGVALRPSGDLSRSFPKNGAALRPRLFLSAAASRVQQPVKEAAVALQRQAQVLRGYIVSPRPLLLQV